jgi:hypothetical protein
MAPQQPAITSTYAGLVAASNAIVTKLARRRRPQFTTIPRGFEPPGLEDMKRILRCRAAGEEDNERLIGRVTAASLSQVLEATKNDENPFFPKFGGYASDLITPREYTLLNGRNELDRVALQRAFQGEAANGDASAPGVNICRYCAMFQTLLEPQDEVVPIEVLSHSARIESDFDSETNCAQAGIKDFQLLVPGWLATAALEASHPLLWETTASDLFEFSRPGYKNPSEKPFIRWHPAAEKLGADELDAWSAEISKGSDRAYLYERAVRPFNEQIKVTIDNVFRITEFANVDSDSGIARKLEGWTNASRGTDTNLVRDLARQIKKTRGAAAPFRFNRYIGEPPAPDRFRILSYGYELETCVSSNFGFGFQSGGLDIDDGRFDGSAFHFKQIRPELLHRLTRSDFVHLIWGLARNYPRYTRETLGLAAMVAELPREPWDSARERKSVMRLVDAIAELLADLWGEDPWLLTISASKRLRYSYPRNGQAEIWALLTYMLPAVLFTFMNRSVCQLPNFLQKESGSRTQKKTTAPPSDNHHQELYDNGSERSA